MFKRFLRPVLAFAAFMAMALCSTSTSAQVTLANPGFEDGTTGLVAAGWRRKIDSSAIVEVMASTSAPAEGTRCQSIRHAGNPQQGDWGAFEQSLDAAPLIGKRIRLRADIRMEHASKIGGAGIWLRVDDESDTPLSFDNMASRLVRSNVWSTHEIIADVLPGAMRIVVGGLQFGGGTSFFDSFALEVLGDTPPPTPPAPLAGPALDNVMTFTRIVGVIQYFHPTDEARVIDWNAFTIHSLPLIEAAPDAATLAARLTDLFAPIAPTARFTVEGAPGDDATAGGAIQLPSGTTHLRSWKHDGYGLSDQGGRAYESKVVRKAVKDSDTTLRVWREAFPAGIVAEVSIGVATDGDTSLPRPAATITIPALTSNSAEDRTVRFAAVINLWNIFQHFHPTVHLYECRWSEQLAPALRSAATDPTPRAFLDTLRRMTSPVNDGHVFVNHASDLRRAFLPLAWTWVGEDLIVTAIAEDVEGLTPGDQVMAIDGVPVSTMAAAAGELICASPHGRRDRTLDELRIGIADAEAKLDVRSPSGEQRTIMQTYRAGMPVELTRPPSMTELSPGVWYIDLSRLETPDFATATEKLKDAKGIVFDLRGYPTFHDPVVFFGYLAISPTRSADWQIAELRTPDQASVEYNTSRWQISPMAPHLACPKIILTDARAISYSESCLAIFKHFKLAEIIGAPTAGANGNVTAVMLPGSYRVSWTGMLVENIDGTRHMGVGVVPDIPMEPTRAGIAAGRDELLEFAVTRLAK